MSRQLTVFDFAQSECNAQRGYATTAYASAEVFTVTLRYGLSSFLNFLLAANYQFKSQGMKFRRMGKLNSSD